MLDASNSCVDRGIGEALEERDSVHSNQYSMLHINDPCACWLRSKLDLTE
jgi:hypothetical protein